MEMNENETSTYNYLMNRKTPLVIKTMSGAARYVKDGFYLGAAKSLKARGLVSERWDNKKNGFIWTVV